MEQEAEHNHELKQELNQMFAELFHDIGNNRQQLTNKVIALQRDINKELGRHPVEEQRKKEILNEVRRTIKMAAGQLPLRKGPPKATIPVSPKPPAKAAAEPAAASPKPKVAPTPKAPAKPVPPTKKSAPKSAVAKKKK